MLKPQLLVIDDDADYTELLKEAFEDIFRVKTANSIGEADALFINDYHCDIALVDENLDLKNKGSDWIAKHKKAGINVTSFVLYSGSASEEAILKGLECGADDFIAKPFSLTVLRNKLLKLIEYQNTISTFEGELKSKNNVINISMAQASKYGRCMQLTSKLNQCFKYEDIRDEIFAFLRDMNLIGCIGFYPLNEVAIFYSSAKGVCSPVEIDVMKLLKVKPRLYTFGSRTIFNHSSISILLLNLEQDTIDTDIYIDAFASVIECVGARMAFLAYQNSLLSIQDKLKKAIETTKKMVAVSKHHQQEVMNEIVQSIGQSFHVLDMNDQQEEYLTNLVHNALKKHSQDDINFLEVSELLDTSLKSMDDLSALNEENIQDENPFDDDDDELF
jgi:DNA-binding response OmpR family regulator